MQTTPSPDFKSDKYKPGMFLRRPVLSTVISIAIVLAGLLSIKALPIAQYPDLVPPLVTVMAMYPGASPEIMAATVASPLEQEINGVDDMIYMSTVVGVSGVITINVSFELGTDPDIATINVSNRVQGAINSLPEDVRRYGVSVFKSSPSILQIVTLTSPEKIYDSIYLSNYALVNVIDSLKRIKGVGDASILGPKDYAMRIWLKPEQMQFFDITTEDVAAAVRDQNAQYAAGIIGSMPSPKGLQMSWQINAKGRLVTAEEFSNIILRTDSTGGVLRLSDVADVELGAAAYDFDARLNDMETVAIAVYLAPGANALETADQVNKTMENLQKSFPYGLEQQIAYDTTIFVKISIQEVIKTLAEAMVLVFLVVYLFLQNWRATLIPCIAVPISIIGTFAGMLLLGFTINTLTLFGLVLAIGIVVDDAIVVLENVERILHTEQGITVRQATAKAMNEVTGPVIAIVLVLCSVFVPVAFLGGLAGEMYKQFAITISISVILSGIVALTLTPTLCIWLLKPSYHEPKGFFKWFNNFFEKITNGFTATVKTLIKSNVLTLGIYAIIIVIALRLFAVVPTGLVPDEDQGYLLALILLPDGTGLQPTSAVTHRVTQEILKNPAVENIINLAGFDLASGAISTNTASLFIMLKSWEERAAMGSSLEKLIGEIYMLGMKEPNAQVLPFNPPPIMGMSNTGGFEMYLQSRDGDVKELADVSREFVAAANKLPQLSGVSTGFSISAPRLYIELDREKARVFGVNVSSVFSLLSSTLGSGYINDFNLMGRTFKVYMQAEADARAYPDDIEKLYVRNNKGDMIPLATLVTLTTDGGPQNLQRFNGFTSAKISGNPGTGFSSGQSLAALEQLAAETLPSGYSIAWGGTSYQEVATGGTDFGVFGLALVMVLLILAAQYEKWTLPLSVISAVPFAVFGAILANWALGLANDVYTQVAIITLLGLASKNAILIVEFASELHRDGQTPMDAAMNSAKLRFRPIIMTSLAFILGCVPLALSSGAGAASRIAIGVSVIGGMLAATILAPLFVPYFFNKITTISEKLSKPTKENDEHETH